MEVIVLGQDSKKSPVAKTPGSSVSLEETLRLIKDKVNAQGEISYIMTSENLRSGGTVQDKYSVETSHARADSRSCRLEMDGRLVLNGVVQSQGHGEVPLKSITTIMVKTQSKAIEEQTARAGVTEWKGSVAPESYVLQTFQSGTLTGVFFFRDQETANLVAKNISRAVELCGGKKGTFSAN